MRISTGWSFERYSTTNVHRYCGSQLSGISLIFHPLPLDSGTTSVKRIIEINWDEKQLQRRVCK